MRKAGRKDAQTNGRQAVRQEGRTVIKGGKKEGYSGRKEGRKKEGYSGWKEEGRLFR